MFLRTNEFKICRKCGCLVKEGMEMAHLKHHAKNRTNKNTRKKILDTTNKKRKNKTKPSTNNTKPNNQH